MTVLTAIKPAAPATLSTDIENCATSDTEK